MVQKREAIPDIKEALNQQVCDNFAWLQIDAIIQISLF